MASMGTTFCGLITVDDMFQSIMNLITNDLLQLDQPISFQLKMIQFKSSVVVEVKYVSILEFANTKRGTD
jgi:hypothetical protein